MMLRLYALIGQKYLLLSSWLYDRDTLAICLYLDVDVDRRNFGSVDE